MLSSYHHTVHAGLRPWVLILAATAGMLRVSAADATPTPDQPTPQVEAESPTPVMRAAPTPRPTRFPQLLGLFRDAHLRAHETTEQVVTVFGDARVDGTVRDQVVSVFGDAELNGHVDGQVVVVFGNGTITRDIDGDVIWLFGRLAISPGVTINGDFFAIGGETRRDPSVVVEGDTFEFSIPGMPQFGSWVRECLVVGRLYRHDRPATWAFVGAMLALSLLLAALFRGPVDAGVGVLERKPGLAFVNGLLVVLLTPPAIILLVALVVGIPVVPFVGVGILFATWIGVISVSRFCGAQIGIGHQPALALVVGFGLLSLLFALPVIGLLTWAAVMMLGVGTATTAWLESRRRDARTNGARPAARATIPVVASAPAPASAPESATTAPVASFAPRPSSPTGEPVNPFTSSAVVEPSSIPTPPPPSTPPPPLAPLTAPMPAGPVVAATPPLPAMALERAEFWPRIAATLLDLIVVGAALGMTGLSFAFMYIWFAYHVAFWAWRGTTLGGVVMNLRIERLDGRRIDASVAIVRACGAIMSFVPLGFGFLWVHWDPEKQSWHDKIAGTVIVRVPRGQALI